MRLLLTVFLLLLFPGTAAAAELSLAVSPEGVRYGSPQEAEGRLTEGAAPLAGQVVELQARAYPFDGAYETIATATTGLDGAYAFERRFDRNVQLRAVAPAQQETSPQRRAYVFPRPRSTFKALPGGRLRITQYLRTPRGVRLTARTNFYLGPKKAKTAPRAATAKPKRIGQGRFKATATVTHPRAWKGSFRYGSCFRYSDGSGMGDPKARCPKRYRF